MFNAWSIKNEKKKRAGHTHTHTHTTECALVDVAWGLIPGWGSDPGVISDKSLSSCVSLGVGKLTLSIPSS